MGFLDNWKLSRYFKKNASRFVKHAMQAPCDVVSAGKDGLWPAVEAQGWPPETRQEFENLLYMACIAARCALEIEALTARRGAKLGQTLEVEFVFRSEQIFGNRQAFEELLRMARDIRGQAPEGGPGERADFCLGQAAARIRPDLPALAPGTFAPLAAMFTEGGLVADLMDQDQA